MAVEKTPATSGTAPGAPLVLDAGGGERSAGQWRGVWIGLHRIRPALAGF